MPLDFPGQIVKSPQVLSHLLLHGEGHPGSHSPFLFLRGSYRRPCGKLRRCTARPVTGNSRETRGRPFSASRVAARYRQQQGDTWPSVLREPCRCPLLKLTTVEKQRENEKSYTFSSNLPYCQMAQDETHEMGILHGI